MVKIIIEIIIVAAVFSFIIPAMMLLLARLDYFPPITIEIMQYKLYFAPKISKLRGWTSTNTVTSTYPHVQRTFSPGTALLLTQLPAGASMIEMMPAEPQTLTKTENIICVYP
jgi:cellulose synthase/poly-beta-1,6-N-acetylglucosamine synthase-like glycosyltransferase